MLMRRFEGGFIGPFLFLFSFRVLTALSFFLSFLSFVSAFWDYGRQVSGVSAPLG